MAKVIFEFNRMEDVEFQKKGGFSVGMSVQLEEQSPKEQTGPHDVMAGIIKSMAPEIIEKATQELLKSARELGLEAEGELFRYNPDAAKH
ncbi:TPA: hypothetical protein OZ641_004800 [Escherichia coli]|uniref:hypothetical protein n=1 Tax=Escherichia coli TaxID=562 RepID=UPI000BB60A7A|nr:hypothetical protein [Escherichia coli]EFC2692087.1 hypothetical protein [Escherichia coli]EKP6476294.1 hypothetical protein [Escherichia coli]EKP6508698.1 hypothetical protein [Escherichia coli]PBR38181.1 hypothetical protein COD53_30345 [Escherichia coli]QHR47135.1 hypothetical protein FNE85_17195 [Escherichia coli]